MYNSGYQQRSIVNDFNSHKNEFNSHMTDFDLEHQSTIHNYISEGNMDTIREEECSSTYLTDQILVISRQLHNLGFLKPLDFKNNTFSSVQNTIEA
jgi:hypothetical protein